MVRKLVFLLLLVLIVAPTAIGFAQEPQGLPVDVPREQLFVLDQIFRYGNVGDYNLWAPGRDTPHRHALMFETLWYRDQETGERIYGLAASDPVYNEDYTQMSVDLRDNIYWTDGVQFTADDVVFTVETLKADSGLVQGGWGAQFNQFEVTVEKTGDFSVQFNLGVANPRFHTLFETRWNGVYMMPKHVFENIDDLANYVDSNPVVLGNYVPVQFDPNGFWELFQRREDPERSVAGVVTGNPGPEYVLSIFYGDSARKAIAMSRGELDTYFDADIEAFETTLDTTPTARSWYTEFPWAYPNENDDRHFFFNAEFDPLLANKDVRWALALSINIVELQTEYIGGVAKVSAMPITPIAPLRAMYYDPMEEWLTNLQIDLGNGEMFNPYDPTVSDQIAAWAEEQGYTVPGEPREVFGGGWWKYAPDVAEQLLLKNGFTRDGSGNWLTPDGQPWVLDVQAPPDENDAFRMATGAADMWSDFGIDVNLQGLERSSWDNNRFTGQFGLTTMWHSFALTDGDMWPQVQQIHSRYYVPNGEDARTSGGGWVNTTRINDPVIDEMIDRMATLEPGTEESVALNREFLQYWTENMLSLPVIGFKKFTTWDERYWTGFPTAEDPNYMPLYWFQGGKFAIQNLTPVGS
jgi:peptide/nickel transport system substrate-binding protein